MLLRVTVEIGTTSFSSTADEIFIIKTKTDQNSSLDLNLPKKIGTIENLRQLESHAVRKTGQPTTLDFQ